MARRASGGLSEPPPRQPQQPVEQESPAAGPRATGAFPGGERPRAGSLSLSLCVRSLCSCPPPGALAPRGTATLPGRQSCSSECLSAGLGDRERVLAAGRQAGAPHGGSQSGSSSPPRPCCSSELEPARGEGSNLTGLEAVQGDLGRPWQGPILSRGPPRPDSSRASSLDSESRLGV